MALMLWVDGMMLMMMSFAMSVHGFLDASGGNLWRGLVVGACFCQANC
jgi:hypothetical protein